LEDKEVEVLPIKAIYINEERHVVGERGVVEIVLGGIRIDGDYYQRYLCKNAEGATLVTICPIKAESVIRYTRK